MTTQDIEKYITKFHDEHAFYTSAEEYLRAVDWLRTTLTDLTQHHEAEVERAVEAERIRLVKTGKLWVEVQEDNISIRKVDLFDLTPTKTDKQNCIECGELVGEHESIRNCHGSCRIEL